jgi:protoporphyrinogen oxidase
MAEKISLLRDVPVKVQDAAGSLQYSSICLTSVGFKKKVNIPSLWFYAYDEEIPFSRAYSPSMKSDDNVPTGKSSIQFETYYNSKNETYSQVSKNLSERIVDSIQKMGIAERDDIEFISQKDIDFANVIFDLNTQKNKKIVQDYLASIGIKTIGRFGKWEYLWSDQAYLSGLELN